MLIWYVWIVQIWAYTWFVRTKKMQHFILAEHWHLKSPSTFYPCFQESVQRHCVAAEEVSVNNYSIWHNKTKLLMFSCIYWTIAITAAGVYSTKKVLKSDAQVATLKVHIKHFERSAASCSCCTLTTRNWCFSSHVTVTHIYEPCKELCLRGNWPSICKYCFPAFSLLSLSCT